MLRALMETESIRERGLLGLPQPSLRLAWVVAETVILTLLSLGIGHLVEPSNPLFIRADVPWSWAAPTLLALRYGVMTGMSSLAILLAAWFFMTPPAAAMPITFFIGALLLTMVCGEFCGAWRGRLTRLTEANSYLEDRIERVTGRLFTVQRSHEMQQQELLQRPSTLRLALDGLVRRILVGQHDDTSAAQAFLDHLAASCQVEDAQVLSLAGLPAGFGPLLGRVGAASNVDFDDPLVQYALQHDSMAHVQLQGSDRGATTRHLVAAPLLLGVKRTPALLVISRMPFLALQGENLQMIAVLCSVLSSAAEVSEGVVGVLERVPHCPARLAEELCRLDRLARLAKLDTHVVLLSFNDPQRSDDQALMAERRARAPDVIWTYTSPSGLRRQITLMPLGGSHVVDGYLASISELFVSRYRAEAGGKGLAGLGISSRVMALGGTEPMGEALARFVAEDAVAPRTA